MLADLLINANGLISALPNVDPQQPPGMENLTTVLGWIAWGVSVLCLAAFLVCAGWLAIATLTGQEVRAAKGLVIVLIAAVIVGAASTLFAILT